MSAKTLDPTDVYKRGLEDPASLSPEERFVYLLMELETLMNMEGWDHFFTSEHLMLYYGELNRGLELAEDDKSLAILKDYEEHLTGHRIELKANAIADFLSKQNDDYLTSCRDWRNDFEELTEGRWQKVTAWLNSRGIRLLT